VITRFLYGRPVTVGLYPLYPASSWGCGMGPYGPPLVSSVNPTARVSGVVVTPDEVQARKIALDAGWSQTGLDITIANVPALAVTAPDGKAFDADFAAWKIFLQEAANTFNAGTQDDTTSLWQQKLFDWQQRAQKLGVTLHGVPIKPPPKPWDPSALAWPVALGLGAVAAAMIFRK
jgi:hypothetical protein